MAGYSEGQWQRKLRNFEGDWDENIGVKGVTPSKTHQLWPICLLSMDNFAIFIDFSFLLFIFPSYFPSSLEF